MNKVKIHSVVNRITIKVGMVRYWSEGKTFLIVTSGLFLAISDAVAKVFAGPSTVDSGYIKPFGIGFRVVVFTNKSRRGIRFAIYSGCSRVFCTRRPRVKQDAYYCAA